MDSCRTARVSACVYAQCTYSVYMHVSLWGMCIQAGSYTASTVCSLHHNGCVCLLPMQSKSPRTQCSIYATRSYGSLSLSPYSFPLLSLSYFNHYLHYLSSTNLCPLCLFLCRMRSWCWPSSGRLLPALPLRWELTPLSRCSSSRRIWPNNSRASFSSIGRCVCVCVCVCLRAYV